MINQLDPSYFPNHKHFLALHYMKLFDDVQDPVFATQESACFDIFAYLNGSEKIIGYDAKNDKQEAIPFLNKFLIEPQSRWLIPTGLIFNIPAGYSVRLHPRSGLALKLGLMLGNSEGVIDSDYYHQTFIMTANFSHEPILVEHGMRIVQAELCPVLQYMLIEDITSTNSMMPRTNRTGGLGSTGVH